MNVSERSQILKRNQVNYLLHILMSNLYERGISFRFIFSHALKRDMSRHKAPSSGQTIVLESISKQQTWIKLF